MMSLLLSKVGGREDSNVYIGQKLKNAAAVGVNASHVKLSQTASQTEVDLCSQSF